MTEPLTTVQSWLAMAVVLVGAVGLSALVMLTVVAVGNSRVGRAIDRWATHDLWDGTSVSWRRERT